MPARISSSSSTSQVQPERRRRRDRDEESDQEDAEAPDAVSDEEDEAPQRAGLSEEELKRKAAKLIRLAFAAEHNKRALRRADTNKIMLLRAQDVLRKTFGMELVELRPKWKAADELLANTQAQTQTQATQSATKKKGKSRQSLDDVDEEDDEDTGGVQETQAATQGGRKNAKPKSTGLYVLRSTLAPELLDRMAEPIAGTGETPAWSDVPDDSGALLDWDRNDGTQSGHIALLGLRTVILCLVMSSGRVISDEQLHVFLKRLGIERETLLPFLPCTSPNSAPLTLDNFLDMLDKQLYLQKVKVPTPGRGDGFGVEWRWGQRDSEMSEKAAAKFIESIMFDGLDQGPLEAEERPRARGRGRARDKENDDEDVEGDIRQQRKRMRKNLEQAVGGALNGEI